MFDIRSGRDVWETIQNCPLPIVLYGMGNGADRIIARLRELDREPSAVFCSDGFVRSKTFHGMPLETLASVEDRFSEFLILLCFGTDLPDVLFRIRNLSERHPLLAPDLPVAGEEFFDTRFYETNLSKIRETESLFSDARSRALYRNWIDYKRSGDIRFLREEGTGIEEIYRSLLCPERYRTAADLGAYDGKTAMTILSVSPGIRRIYAFEPDPKNYKKLERNISASECVQNVILPVRSAAWDREETLSFRVQGNRNSAVSDMPNISPDIQGLALDTIAEAPVDLIRFDVEGAEMHAIEGAKTQIADHAPDLIVSLYHRSRDTFEIPLRIRELNPAYRFYLRRIDAIPAWDVYLIATCR